MKWLILFIWLGSILFIYLRGVVRPPLKRQLLHQSSLLAPLNALLILISKVPTTPYVPVSRIPALKLLEENWQTIRDEAPKLKEATAPTSAAPAQATDPSDSIDSTDSSTSFEPDRQFFYLKGQASQRPAAESPLYPKTVALLAQIPDIKAAMFAELPARASLNPSRGTFANSLHYHLGLSTSNDEGCYIDVDGLRYVWHDGEGVLFDQTYLHEAHNNTDSTRLILFCDVQRPLQWRAVERFNQWVSRLLKSAASLASAKAKQTGFTTGVTQWRHRLDQKRQAFKATNQPLYKAIEVGLVVLAILLFLAI